MSELKPGIDRPGGATARKPETQRGVDHGTSIDPELGRVFGKPEPGRRGYSPLREQVKQTVVPVGLVKEEAVEERKPLQIGDVLPLDSGIIGYQEYKPGQWGPVGTIMGGDYTLARIVRVGPNAKPLFEFTREISDNKPTVHVYVKPLGHGKGWERVERERK